MAWNLKQRDILKTHAGCIPIDELAVMIGKSTATVSQFASRQGISISFFGHGRKQVSDSVVCEIKRLLRCGDVTNRQIAKITGTKESYIASIKAGRFRNEIRGSKRQLKPDAQSLLIRNIFS